MSQTYRLDWPDGFDRTPAREREPYPHGYQVTRTEAFRSVWNELDRMDVRNPRIDTAAPHTQDEPWRPYSDQDPDDPGVVARWEDATGQGYAAPCDRWDNLRDNARSIAKYLEAKRGIDRWGVATVTGEFGTQALPGPDDEDALARGPPPHEVLDVAPDADRDVIEAAVRAKKGKFHPDGSDPDETKWKQVQRAEEVLLDDE